VLLRVAEVHVYQESLPETAAGDAFPRSFPVFSGFGQDSGGRFEAKEIMITNHRLLLTAALWPVAFGQCWAQAPPIATLDITFENAVTYADLGDPLQYATSSSPPVITSSPKNFGNYLVIADIVSVNGKPARGSFVGRGRVFALFRNAMPGQAISDLSVRGGLVDTYLEILQSDNTPVGTITAFGFTGGGPPPGAPGQCCNQSVTGGTGAFQGVRGALTADLSMGYRVTTMVEDPAYRRINGGTRGHFYVYVTPISWPQIVTAAGAPSVLHADLSPVTAAKQARAGETLIVTASGLGPTVPALPPGTPFPDNPVQQVNSPLEVTVNGKSAEVLNKIGWPGTTDTYRVDIVVPDGTAPGMAVLQLTAAFISGGEARIAVQ
jgi:hypothetical protein